MQILATLLSKRDQEVAQYQSLNKFQSPGLSKNPSLYKSFKEILNLNKQKIHNKMHLQFFLQTIHTGNNQTKTKYCQEKGPKTNKKQEMTIAEIQSRKKSKVQW